MNNFEKKTKKNKLVKSKSLLLRRVVKDKDKSDKRDLIVDLAGRILLSKDYSELSMDLVAKEAGLAKGTLYIYFKSKEEIGLEILERDYVNWFSELAHALKSKSIKNSTHLSQWIVKSLRTKPRFLKLIPIGASILESNVTEEFILGHKLRLSRELEKTAQELSLAFPALNIQKAALLLVQIHIVVIGSWTHGFPHQKVQKVIKENSIRTLDFNYFELLGLTLNTLLASI